MSDTVIETVLAHYFSVGAPDEITDVSDIKYVLEELVHVVNTMPNDIEIHLTYMMSLLTRDSVLDEFRTVKNRVQDIFTLEEVISFWEAFPKLAANILRQNVSEWCIVCSDSLCMAIIVRTARKCIRCLTVNFMIHKKYALTNQDTYMNIFHKYQEAVSLFDKIVHELMSLFPFIQMVADSRVLGFFDNYRSIAVSVRTSNTREVKLNELLRSPTCKPLRDLLNSVPSKGQLLMNAPDLNACSLCHKVFLCMGVAELPFVIFNSCRHLVCKSCIHFFYSTAADSICTINDCNKWNPFWITEGTFHNYKVHTRQKVMLIPTCLLRRR